MQRTSITALVCTFSSLVLLVGCGASDGSSADVAAPEANTTMKTPKIEEPDIYQLSGNWLYVQSAQTGLNIIDVSTPSRPVLVGRAAVTGAAGTELYLHRKDQAIVMLKGATAQCQMPLKLEAHGWSYGSEVVLVDTTDKKHPAVKGRYCLPGQLVASRTVDDILVVVTRRDGDGSRAISLDITDPHNARVVQELPFPSVSQEIKVTAKLIVVAGKTGSASGPDTWVQLIRIDSKGKMTQSGDITLDGEPRGRFHMDLYNDMLRIVTYEKAQRRSWLFVVDVKDPDHPKVIGQVQDIGRWEQLKATRFDGDRAYVVTYRQSDPLWVVDLADPTFPKVVGELHVPGWSDFLFPRGKSLIAVGRGNSGYGIQVSHFDVSDPKNPRSLAQVQLGQRNSQSEANVDHRGVTILDLPGQNPVVAVPYTSVVWDGGCTIQDRVQLVEVTKTGLQVRGQVSQSGRVLRSAPVSTHLYTIGDFQVQAVDIRNLDHPTVAGAVTVGTDPGADAELAAYCDQRPYPPDYYEMGDDMRGSANLPFMCSVPGSTDRPAGTLPIPPATVLLGLAVLVLRLRRGRR